MIAARQSADAAEVDNGGGVPKPQSPSPRDPRDIPALAGLASERCWCVWSWEWDEKRGEGKWTKPPRRPDGAFARNNDPTTWFSFEECWRQVMAGQADGIGFMMLGLAGGKLAAIDLDKVRDPDSGALLPWAERLVEEAGSYCEVTPSETGLRILGNAAGIGTMHRKIP